MLDGLAAYERRHGWKGNLLNVVANGESLASYRHVDWDSEIRPGSYVHALVTDVAPAVRHRQVRRLPGAAWPGGNQVDALHLAAAVPDPRRHRLCQGRGAERSPEPRRAGAGIRRAGRAAGARQLHRRHQGHGGRTRLRAIEVQPRHAGLAPGRLVVQAVHLYRSHRSGHDARRHRARRADQLSQRPRACTRRTTTTASSRASLPSVTRWRSRATFRR